ncbi:hypothetical protein D1872_249380 [compost metagenome]
MDFVSAKNTPLPWDPEIVLTTTGNPRCFSTKLTSTLERISIVFGTGKLCSAKICWVNNLSLTVSMLCEELNVRTPSLSRCRIKASPK